MAHEVPASMTAISRFPCHAAELQSIFLVGPGRAGGFGVLPVDQYFAFVDGRHAGNRAHFVLTDSRSTGPTS